MTPIIKKNYLIDDTLLSELIPALTSTFNIPIVSSSLGMYSTSKNRVLEVMFHNATCYLMSKDKNSKFDKKYIDIFQKTPPIQIENKNIKFFLKILSELGYSKAHISDEVIRLKYADETNSVVITLNIGTPIGNVLVIQTTKMNLSIQEISKYLTCEISAESIDEKFSKIPKESVFNRNGVLNSKIINYGNKYGIDISSHGTASIKSMLESKSNDYGTFEKFYQIIIGDSLNKPVRTRNKKYLKPVSVVIPAKNPDDSLIKCLYAIHSQRLSRIQKKNIEVIVIDDGSLFTIADILASHIDNFSFDLKIIRLEKCSGISNARNLGAQRATHKHLIFVDADILISEDYILEHSIANQLIPNGVFVSMKKNIEKESENYTIDKITKGLITPNEFDDKRISRVFEKGQKWINQVNHNGVLETLSETDSFKNFGHGRQINGYDLPSMCVGHNMSFNAQMLKDVGGFSNNFVGWGLEDAYFGANAIANGGFLVPLTSVGVYHIDHPPRSGSTKKKEQEYSKNLDIYNMLVNKEIYD